MLLVADSGSTKADWKLADNGKEIAGFNTMGFNPVFHNSETVYKHLLTHPEIISISENVTALYFFGAGCSHPDRNKIIESGLKRIFKNAAIHVGHDLDACAYATCENKPGIACILGTGSNSSYFDGKNVIEFNHGLGYVLGDEGSGSYFGKKLISRFLYKMMPEELHESFFADYKITKEIAIENIYKKPYANVYMASFAPFLSKHKDHPFIKTLMTDGFGEFLDVNVCNIPEHKNVPVHFIGSIAFYFSDYLKEAATQRQLLVGNIIQKPIDGLLNYLINN